MSDNNRAVFDTLKTEHQKVLFNIVFEAMNQTDAYLDAYQTSSPDSARGDASRLLSNSNMQEAKQELMDELKEQSTVSFEWCAKQLVEAIQGAKDEDKIDYNSVKGCVNELNKMMGHHAAEKKDITTKGESLNALSDEQIDARLLALENATTES
jgi:phage terminase small subunit